MNAFNFHMLIIIYSKNKFIQCNKILFDRNSGEGN